MIISVSRRTDIPAYFSEWFYNRLKAKEVITINPMNKKQAHLVSLDKESVDCFVFWTKNPKNFMKRLDELDGYNYYFQFTLTPYASDIEPSVPRKKEIIEIFTLLSKRIGKEKVLWRYDPILLNDKYTKEYHYEWFKYLASKLYKHTDKVIISFYDAYSKTKRNTKELKLHDITHDIMNEMASKLSSIAKEYGLVIETCAEGIDLDKYGIKHGKCIDDKLIAKITRKTDFSLNKDKNQRKDCGCISSVDIGSYNTCLHKCRYCYANYSDKTVELNVKNHNKKSQTLVGEISEDIKVFEKNPKIKKPTIFD